MHTLIQRSQSLQFSQRGILRAVVHENHFEYGIRQLFADRCYFFMENRHHLFLVVARNDDGNDIF